jgi:CRISPR-associated protein Csx17
MNMIPLSGCAPVPLAHYLKALGILRLVTEDKDHGDPQVGGFWKNDCFYLSTRLSEQELVEFFLNYYQPTPIIVPWSGSDFFDVDWKTEAGKLQNTFEKRPTASTIIEAFLVSTSPRLTRYRDVLSLVPKAFEKSGVSVKKDIEGAAKSKNKVRLLQVLRNSLPDDSVAWLDCTTVIETDQLAFNTILGSGGGSDGNSHFSDNFMQALWMVLPEFEEQQRKPTKAASGEPFVSSAALRESIFGSSKQSVNISKFSPVLFDSSRVGGINSISGFNADSASNPWDFVLMMEGAFLFAGAVSKKLRSFQPGVARFPFLLEGTPVGLASVGNRDEGRELWLPLWDRPSTYAEIAQVFAEARIEKFGRTATTGFDAFVALARHGVDRGIQRFQRIGLVRGRVGGDNYFTSIDQGIFRVRDNKAIDLLQPLDKWHSELLRFAGDEKKCPQSILSTLRNMKQVLPSCPNEAVARR